MEIKKTIIFAEEIYCENCETFICLGSGDLNQTSFLCEKCIKENNVINLIRK